MFYLLDIYLHSGSDIMDGNKSLTLALVWQMMRAYTLSLLAQVPFLSFLIKNTLEFPNGNRKPETLEKMELWNRRVLQKLQKQRNLLQLQILILKRF